MTASANRPKTFNNPVGFERGLWQRKSGEAARVPKRSVLGRVARDASATLKIAALNIVGGDN